MEVCKLYFTLVAIPFFTFLIMAAADDFDTARQKIEKAKPNIDYNTLCSERKAGREKIACHIEGVPSVGFVVCKKPLYKEKGLEKGEDEQPVSCSDVIHNELDKIVKVFKGNVKTVKIILPIISGVKCVDDPSLDCSGFLAEWVAPEKGQFKRVSDHIVGNTVRKLTADVKKFTTSGLTNTTADLIRIKNYMILNAAENKYRQICDLQGFFLVKGGFLLMGVSDIRNTGINEGCWPGDPTTQQVLDGFNEMITAFKKSA